MKFWFFFSRSDIESLKLHHQNHEKISIFFLPLNLSENADEPARDFLLFNAIQVVFSN